MEFRNLTKLITELKDEAKSDWAIKEDMASMYQQDADDSQEVMDHINNGHINTAADKVNSLDTAIREGVVIALAKDMGNNWVANNLGWSVN